MTLNANHLRRFVLQVASVCVIFEHDLDFGTIEYCSSEQQDSAQQILALDLFYFFPEQQTQLKAMLLDHQTVFSDHPGQCAIAFHKINLEEGFRPKSRHTYRIPDKLKNEVNKQIYQLLKD